MDSTSFTIQYVSGTANVSSCDEKAFTIKINPEK